MSDTKLISLRIPVELLAEVDSEAKKLERSRHWLILWRIKNGRTLPPIYSVNSETGEITRILEGGIDGGSGGNSGEAGNNQKVDERGVGGGVKEPDAGAVRTRGVRSVVGGGGGEAAGKEKASKRIGAKNSRRVKAQKDAEIEGVRGGCEGDVSAGWFPSSMCPHGYQNSFKCEVAGGGCKR